MSLLVQNISLTLGKKRILRDVSFTLADGEFLSLLGASGAGKSTTLKVIAGLLEQDSGHLLLGGEMLDDVPPYQRKLAVVFQDIRLFPNMNVAENVAFALRMQGMGKTERLAKANEVLELVQLPGFGKRKVQEISGGQQQRVALARAIAANPRLLLLDEPFSGLDESLRDDMRLLVLQIHRQLDISTLMVTHDAYEALMMSDHIVYMTDGCITQDDLPEALYRCPQSLQVAACFGDCSVLAGQIEQGVFKLGAFMAPIADGLPDGPAQAIVRHQALHPNIKGEIELPVRQCIYHGDFYLAEVGLGEQTLTIRTDSLLRHDSPVRFSADPKQIFTFSQSNDPQNR
jgi:putative spermidine/putrescine transport system ATP-binding protein